MIVSPEFGLVAATLHRHFPALSGAQIGGAVGYMQRIESGLRPDALNPASGAYGIAQWLGPRLALLKQWFGPRASLAEQADYLAIELLGPERSALRHLAAQPDERSAFMAWGTWFERPGAADLARASGKYKPSGYPA